MLKHFVLVTLEIILIAAVGILTNLVTSDSNKSVAYVWIGLIVVLLILIPTTWFRISAETKAEQKLPEWKFLLPKEINISISLESIKKYLRFILALLINGILFGWVVANASFFSVYVSPVMREIILPFPFINLSTTVFSFEVIGVFIIAFASVFIWRRISWVSSVLFCIVSSIAFSVTHMSIYPSQPAEFTILGNLLSAILLTFAGLLLFPLFQNIGKLMTDFWKGEIK
jgi:hypothetical protein